MKILSMCLGHDSSACLLENGNVIFFMEEEKLTFHKKDDYPTELFKEIKKYVNDEVDVYVTTFVNHKEINFISTLWSDSFLKKHNIKVKTLIEDKNHHLMHASCAFYSSGFSEALVFVSDGGGRIEGDCQSQEFESVFFASYPSKFNLLEKLHRTSFTKWDDNNPVYSIGFAFHMICEILAIAWYDAGKVMGLSAYGKENKNIQNFFYKKNNKWLANKYYFKIWLAMNKEIKNDSNLIQMKKNLELFQYKADLAYKLQKQSKESSLDRINDLIKKNKVKNFVMTGGYALNCVNNYEYIKAFPNINFYFDPLANDAGTSFGAAKYYWHKLTNDKTIRPLTSLYLGHEHQ